MATIISTTGTVTKVRPANGKTFTLEEMQKIVHGYIEVVHLSKRSLLIVNEEGKLHNLPHNPTATSVMFLYGFRDTIVGDALLVNNTEID